MGEKAFAVFLAEAVIEVVTFGATWGRTEDESFVATDGTVEKLLPSHIAAVPRRQRLEMTQQQPAKLLAIAQAEILPQMVGPQATTRDHVSKPTLKFRAVCRTPAQQFPQ